MRTRDRKYVAAPAGGSSDPTRYEPFVPDQEDEEHLGNAARADRAEALREAIELLPDRQRTCTILSLEGLTGRQIADRLGVTESAVSHSLKAARLALAEELAELY
jgi:RNA polymerase sigma factor (sigma-70 family)